MQILKMLEKTEYLLTKNGLDTAENGLSKMMFSYFIIPQILKYTSMRTKLLSRGLPTFWRTEYACVAQFDVGTGRSSEP